MPTPTDEQSSGMVQFLFTMLLVGFLFLATSIVTVISFNVSLPQAAIVIGGLTAGVLGAIMMFKNQAKPVLVMFGAMAVLTCIYIIVKYPIL